MSTPYEQYRHPTCKNMSAEEIPSFAIMKVTGLSILDGHTILEVDKSDGSGDVHVSNGPVPIPISGYGNYFDGAGMFPVSSSTTTLGAVIGPESGSWIAAEAAGGYIVVGEIKTGVAMAYRQGGGSDIFPVDLEHVGGEDGSSEVQCSWRYNIRAFGQTAIIKADVNPGLTPHRYKRPNLGKMTKADFGTALYDGGEVVVTSTNETIVCSTC